MEQWRFQARRLHARLRGHDRARRETLATQPARDRLGVGQDRRLEHVTIRDVTIEGVLLRERDGLAVGLDLAQVFGFAAIVMAGASSLVALQLLAEQTPALMIIAAAGLVGGFLASRGQVFQER